MGDYMNYIKWLEEWYKSQCDGEWEHLYGVKIETLDNPGWFVTIDLADTELEDKNYDGYQFINEEDDDDWITCRLKNGRFEGFGGPSKLEEIIQRFKEWAQQ